MIILRFRKILACGMCYASMLPMAPAQQASIEPVRPSAFVLVRPYLAPQVPPIRLSNSERLRQLIRAGSLYLTVQDAIALALENNLDIEIARYNPLALAWQLERSQAGGALPGVPSGASQAASVAAGQGVQGSQAAAGVTVPGGNGGAGGRVNASISQVGPVTQTLDPSIQEATTFSHRSIPQQNSVQSGTPVLISNTRVYTGAYQQGFLSGGSITLSYNDHYLNENAASDLLNPSVSNSLSFTFQHNLLRGFGVAVNARTITIARMNLQTSDLNLKSQVVALVGQVLNSYYALLGDYEDIKAKQSAATLAQQLYEDNTKQVRIGSLAPLDVTSAENQVAATAKDLLLSNAAWQQEELRFKSLISRTGVGDPLLASVHIVPIDPLVTPSAEDLPPVQELVKRALANRSDLAAQQASVRAAEVSALGTASGILPSLQVLGGANNQGLAGVPHTVFFQGRPQVPDPFIVGNIGTALEQIFRRDYPSQHIGGFASVPVFNRQAQADYGVDQLQLRQSQLTTQKQMNQLEVDVMNAVVAVRQAKVRYDAAVRNHALQKELLEGEQRKFVLGATTPYNVVQEQRDLAVAQSSEIGALVGYNTARVALDQTLGTILDTHHISIDEVRAGKISPDTGKLSIR
jgi:outer membrane protein